MVSHMQDEVQAHSLKDPESFWSAQAKQLHWHKKPSRALKRHNKKLPSGAIHPSWTWFPDGEISTSYNCVERHVRDGHGASIAIAWDSPVTGMKEQISYRQLLDEVEVLAAVLKEQGVRKGDVILVYMPMIPAALFAILASAHIGATHAVVFGGFASASLAQRIEASKPRAIVTASCGIEGTKGPLSYKPLVQEAIAKSSHKPGVVLVWQREQLRWDSLSESNGEKDWKGLVTHAKARGLRASAEPVKSDDGLYIIYTSGTTGTPKGVLRSAGGHAVGLNLTIRYIFGIRGPGDVIFTASDIGWVVGHSYIIYAPLLAGATTVLFEGKPIGTPDAGTFWRIAEEYKVNSLFTAPTALRAIRREDPQNKLFEERGRRGGLKQLRALFLAGERSEPSIVNAYQDLLKKYCGPGSKVIDNWWSSESGSPISSLALLPAFATSDPSQQNPQTLEMRPGSAGKAMPGFDVRLVDDDGKELKSGDLGNIVLAMPLAPTGFTTLFNDEERFYQGYLKRFKGKWLDTGDTGTIDAEGYIQILSRSDDLLNIAAHRLSSSLIEQTIASHPDIAESCVVGVPDALKGQLPFSFITLSTANHPSSAIPSEALFKQVQKQIREQIGGIASLGGMIQGQAMIPKTRSGKTLRRVLRELLENAVHGEYDKAVQVPATVDDGVVVETARQKIREYFEEKGTDLHRATESKAKL